MYIENGGRSTKRIWEAKIWTKKERGRPREMRKNTIEKIVKRRKINWRESKLFARNKELWYKCSINKCWNYYMRKH